MRKSLIKLLLAVAALMLSTAVSAVGMGGINVSSALGQPLKADIELVAVNNSEKASLVARLASPETYKSAGLEYPYGNKFKFLIESRAGGESYLSVTSAQPINDPFVTMMVELTWSAGKLVREYTFLLDPPGYVPAQPALAAVQPVAPAVQLAESSVPTIPVQGEAGSGMPALPVEAAVVGAGAAAASGVSESPSEAAAASGVTVMPGETASASGAPAAVTEAAVKPVQTAPSTVSPATSSIIIPPPNKEWFVVQRGDTMMKLAEQYKLADISLERMLVALYRANIDEFDEQNMNRIKAGKILRLPKAEDAERLTQSQAKREIRAQAADWNVYRQKLASAAALRKETQLAQQESTGKISSSVADKAPVAKESAREVLKLSKGEAPGDQVATGAGGKPLSAQDKAQAAQEDSIAKAKAAKEEQMRTAMLEQNMKAMEELAKLKAELAQAQAKAPAQVQPAQAQPDHAQPAQAPAPVQPEAVSKVVVATPLAAAKPVPKPEPTSQEPSFVDQMLKLLDQILDEPLYLAGGAGALIVLGGLGFLMKRPGGLKAIFKLPSGLGKMFKGRKKKPSVDLDEESSGDYSQPSGHITAPVVSSPETGDFTQHATAQADTSSDNVDPISEADLFLNFGRDAQAEEILKEALKSSPNNHQIHLKLLSIYTNRKDADSFAAIASILKDSGNEYAWQEAVTMGRELDPNNPLYGAGGNSGDAGAIQQASGSSPAPADTHATPAAGMDFDFDLGALSGNAAAAPSPEQNFLGDADQTVIMTAGQVAAIQQPSTMDFDVTAASPSAPGVSEAAAAPDLDGLIFDVTGSHPAMPAAQPEVSKPASSDDGGMEFTMDFPTKEAVKSAPAALAAEADLAGISLDLGETPASGGSAEGKDDHWHEVATKLDLAKAYQEMGDADGVREILAEVLNEGDAEQQEAAKAMLKQLS